MALYTPRIIPPTRNAWQELGSQAMNLGAFLSQEEQRKKEEEYRAERDRIEQERYNQSLAFQPGVRPIASGPSLSGHQGSVIDPDNPDRKLDQIHLPGLSDALATPQGHVRLTDTLVYDPDHREKAEIAADERARQRELDAYNQRVERLMGPAINVFGEERGAAMASAMADGVMPSAFAYTPFTREEQRADKEFDTDESIRHFWATRDPRDVSSREREERDERMARALSQARMIARTMAEDPPQGGAQAEMSAGQLAQVLRGNFPDLTREEASEIAVAALDERRETELGVQSTRALIDQRSQGDTLQALMDNVISGRDSTTSPSDAGVPAPEAPTSAPPAQRSRERAPDGREYITSEEAEFLRVHRKMRPEEIEARYIVR